MNVLPLLLMQHDFKRQLTKYNIKSQQQQCSIVKVVASATPATTNKKQWILCNKSEEVSLLLQASVHLHLHMLVCTSKLLQHICRQMLPLLYNCCHYHCCHCRCYSVAFAIVALLLQLAALYVDCWLIHQQCVVIVVATDLLHLRLLICFIV